MRNPHRASHIGHRTRPDRVGNRRLSPGRDTQGSQAHQTQNSRYHWRFDERRYHNVPGLQVVDGGGMGNARKVAGATGRADTSPKRWRALECQNMVAGGIRPCGRQR